MTSEAHFDTKPTRQRPKIFVDSGQLRIKVAQALDALTLANDPPVLFRRAGILVRLRDNGDSVEIEAFDDAALLAELAEGFTEAARQLGKLVRAEQEQGQHANDNELSGADVEHESLRMALKPS